MMTIIDHIEEFRRRVIFILIFIFALSFIAFFASDHLIRFVDSNMPENVELIVTTPLEIVLARIGLSIFVSILVSIPFIIYQIAKFVKPAFSEKEKKYMWAIPLSLFLFVFGFSSAFLFIVKFGMNFLASNAASLGIRTLWSLNDTIFFIFSLSFIFGLCFQLPLVVLILNKIGLASHTSLKRYRKYVYVFIFILGAVVTPTVDPFTQIVISVPLIVLYEISLLLVKIF